MMLDSVPIGLHLFMEQEHQPATLHTVSGRTYLIKRVDLQRYLGFRLRLDNLMKKA